MDRALRARRPGRIARAEPGASSLSASDRGRCRGGDLRRATAASQLGPREDPALADATAARAGDAGPEHGRRPAGPTGVGQEAAPPAPLHPPRGRTPDDGPAE